MKLSHKSVLKGLGFTGCGKTRQWACFVTGHDFNRAANAPKQTSGFSPCGFFSYLQLSDG
jgi:hypothetical protein